MMYSHLFDDMNRFCSRAVRCFFGSIVILRGPNPSAFGLFGALSLLALSCIFSLPACYFENANIEEEHQSIRRALEVSGPIPPPPSQCGTLRPKEALLPGYKLYSCDGRYALTIGEDGNLTLYGGDTLHWSSNTSGQSVHHLALNDEGNLLLVDTNGDVVWDTATSAGGGAEFHIRNDGNMMLVDTLNTQHWSSGTQVVPPQCNGWTWEDER